MNLLDTNVAVELLEGNSDVTLRVGRLSARAGLSIVTRVELAGGALGEDDDARHRRARLQELLAALEILPFGDAEATAYDLIARQTTFSRRKVLDRMIAAQAIVAEAALVTLNSRDFADVPGLRLADW